MAEAAKNPMAKAEGSSLVASFQGMNSLPVLRQIGLLIGLAASVAAGVAIVLWSTTPSYNMLFGNLSEMDANAVVEALQAQGVEYKIDSTTGAVMVPARDMYEVRLKLAAEGLPRGTGVGYESLQQDSGFGTSQFLETARFNRSLEVELARSISKINSVQSARVHLAIPKGSVFVRNRQKPTASVIVHLFNGRTLEEQQVSAITYLVSSSVPDMEPGSVTVVDQKGRMLSEKLKSQQMSLTSDQFEYTQKLEQSFAERIMNILTPIVGQEGVKAQVVTDVDFTVTEQTQELYNPDAPALRSQQSLEEQSTGMAGGGVPGALSNQPPTEGTAPETTVTGDAGGTQQPTRVKRNSTMNYELDKTISHTRIAPGRIHRLSVAVVVDDRLLPNGERRSHTPEEIERMKQLVKDAVGFNVQRGDSVSVTNVAFTQPVPMEDLPEVPMWEEPWFWDVAKQALGGLVLLMLVFGLLRPMMRSLIEKTPAKSAPPASLEGLTPEQIEKMRQGGGSVPFLQAPEIKTEDRIQDARKISESEPQLVAEVLKGWVAMEDSK
jgi:flagellar M-ring protein FliF